MSEGDANGLGNGPGLGGEGKERVGNRTRASSDHVGGDATAHGQGTATGALRALSSGFRRNRCPISPAIFTHQTPLLLAAEDLPPTGSLPRRERKQSLSFRVVFVPALCSHRFRPLTRVG